MSDFLYNGYVDNLATAIDAKLGSIQSTYNMELGAEFEIAICELIKAVLPNKWGVCRGFVVRNDGELAGDDIIVFDKSIYPTLALRDDPLARKEYVPVEAVVAYIEAKHSLQLGVSKNDSSYFGQSLEKAVEQISNVTKIASGRYNGNQYLHHSNDKIFYAVFSRFVRNKKQELEQPSEIISLLGECNYPIDVIVAGPDIVVPTELSLGHGIGMYGYAWDEIKKDADVSLQPAATPKRALAIGVLLLLQALDSIKLRQIDWGNMIRNAIDPDRFPVLTSVHINQAANALQYVGRGKPEDERKKDVREFIRTLPKDVAIGLFPTHFPAGQSYEESMRILTKDD